MKNISCVTMTTISTKSSSLLCDSISPNSAMWNDDFQWSTIFITCFLECDRWIFLDMWIPL